MNVTREDMPGREVALTIELDAETISTALDRAYRQLVNQAVTGITASLSPPVLRTRQNLDYFNA